MTQIALVLCTASPTNMESAVLLLYIKKSNDCANNFNDSSCRDNNYFNQ